MSNPTKFEAAFNNIKDDNQKNALGANKDAAKSLIGQICENTYEGTLSLNAINAFIAMFPDEPSIANVFDELSKTNPAHTRYNFARNIRKHETHHRLYKYPLSTLASGGDHRVFDTLDMQTLQEYSVHKEKPEIIQRMNRQQNLHEKFMYFRSNPDKYLENRNLEIQEAQKYCSNRFNELLKEYMRKNIPYEIAKQYASQLVEIEYKARLTKINIDWPTNFKEVEGYDELKNFQFVMKSN